MDMYGSNTISTLCKITELVQISKNQNTKEKKDHNTKNNLNTTHKLL